MLQANQRLGDFTIVRLLGKGGMGEVYEARQHNPQRLVAVKVLPAWLAAHSDAVERFRREADALARLDHPFIIRIFTTGLTEEGTFFFSMQLVRGVSLSPKVFYVMGPLLFLVLLVPFTINGIAVRESFFVSFLAGLGVDPDRAFAVGFLFFVVTITLSIPGALVLGWENLRGTRANEQPRLERSG